LQPVVRALLELGELLFQTHDLMIALRHLGGDEIADRISENENPLLAGLGDVGTAAFDPREASIRRPRDRLGAPIRLCFIE
jgi:hypothetical protein